MNPTIFQYFHWYFPKEKSLWVSCAESACGLATLGVTHIWLPPAYKSAKGEHEPGYAVYDLYDLGEFNQKGSVRTKYGTKEEYLTCIQKVHDNHMKVLADIVFNHKMGGDEDEKFPVIWVNAENRNEKQSAREEITEKIRFTFPGRSQKYSAFIWDWQCFKGMSRDGRIGLIQNQYAHKGWDESLDKENGNYDYLMGYDVEFRNPCVKDELFRWAEWYMKLTQVDGFRLDGLKHMLAPFFVEFLTHLETTIKKPIFSIGEFWKQDVHMLLEYIKRTNGKIRLFDVPLHFKFQEASQKGKDFDLRTIFDNTLVQSRPDLAITFVDNHDTQPLQALHSTVQHWFKPLAYALILLREQGIPCIFHPDLYGTNYTGEKEGKSIHIDYQPACLLEKMMRIRKHSGYGLQRDYLDDAHLIAWTREGDAEHNGSGYAVLISNENGGEKWMSLGDNNKHRELYELTGQIGEKITLNENGEGFFKGIPGKVTIWLFTETQTMLNS